MRRSLLIGYHAMWDTGRRDGRLKCQMVNNQSQNHIYTPDRHDENAIISKRLYNGTYEGIKLEEGLYFFHSSSVAYFDNTGLNDLPLSRRLKHPGDDDLFCEMKPFLSFLTGYAGRPDR